MVYLSSSAIRAVDYDSSSGTLKIWFASKGPYSFYRVPPEVYRGLINAYSVGTYYNRFIRGRYR